MRKKVPSQVPASLRPNAATTQWKTALLIAAANPYEKKLTVYDEILEKLPYDLYKWVEFYFLTPTYLFAINART